MLPESDTLPGKRIRARKYPHFRRQVARRNGNFYSVALVLLFCLTTANHELLILVRYEDSKTRRLGTSCSVAIFAPPSGKIRPTLAAAMNHSVSRLKEL